MIKETDGDSFEDMRSLQQVLTFAATIKEFAERKIELGVSQMKTLGILNMDGIYTNLGLLLSEQCTHTVKASVSESSKQAGVKTRDILCQSLKHCSHLTLATSHSSFCEFSLWL